MKTVRPIVLAAGACILSAQIAFAQSGEVNV